MTITQINRSTNIQFEVRHINEQLNKEIKKEREKRKNILVIPLCIYVTNLLKVFSFSDPNKSINLIILGCLSNIYLLVIF